jgi:hypothetical protein
MNEVWFRIKSLIFIFFSYYLLAGSITMKIVDPTSIDFVPLILSILYFFGINYYIYWERETINVENW